MSAGWDWDSRDDGRRETALPYSKETQVGRHGPAVPKRARRTPAVREAQELFKTIVCSEDCLVEGKVSGACEPPLQAAHVVSAAELRKRGLGHLVYDPTNAIALCYRHHRRHDNWTEKIPRHLLPARCFAWAEAHNLTDALEKAWPA